MKPSYDLDKIKFSIDQGSFERAVALYEKERVAEFKEDFLGYSAVVFGGQAYKVFVSSRDFDRGSCDCYLGQNDRLCKHIIALAIYALKRGKKLNQEEREVIEELICNEKLGELSKEKLSEVKKDISQAMRYIKAYSLPSKYWFAYQRSLSEACARLRKIISKLPVSKQTAQLLVDMLIRLDKKICEGGVDDSDGTVGGFIEEVVILLQKYAELDKGCVRVFRKLCKISTCFCWQESLVKILDEQELE